MYITIVFLFMKHKRQAHKLFLVINALSVSVPCV